jgi:hypothetical protein
MVPGHEWLGYFRGNYLNIDFKRPRDYFETTMRSFNSCLMHCVFSTKERRP